MPDVRNILGRAAVVYLVLGAALFYGVDRKSVAEHAWPKTLSRLRPSYAYLIDASEGKPVEKNDMIDGWRYFSAVARVMGKRADTDAFLGVSEYYLGHFSKSKTIFTRLKQAAPGFFWADYNLMLLAIREGNLDAAADAAANALSDPLDKSLAFMAGEKVYQPLMAENRFTPARLTDNMQQVQKTLVYILLTLKQGRVPPDMDRFPARVF